jgi:hypothetical protein
MDPSSPYAKYFHQNVLPAELTVDKPCVAFLGEPGIGKSTALQESMEEVRNAIKIRNEQLLEIDLREYGSEDRLERRLTKDTAWDQWVTGKSVLHLFLDSLDECQIRIPAVAALLMRMLREQKERIGQLRLRIACRTADWPSQFEHGFPELWGKDNYEAYELVPLRRSDVSAEAKSAGLDPEQFLSAVAAADAQPLAIKPITLKFLIDVFRGKGSLPKSQSELYGMGCRILVTELSPSRTDAGHRGNLDPDRRLAIAARTAAILIFCGKTTISTDAMSADSTAVVSLATFTGGTEKSGGNNFEINESMVREVLDTGLFSSRGPNRFGFSHQTYAEYLAAHYLVSHHLDPRQIKSLICHQDEASEAVVPQLSETVGWLAGMNRSVFAQVVRTDPEMLLRSDAGTADHEERQLLADALLKQVLEGKMLDLDWSLRKRYSRFAHPGLAEQLKPIILNKSIDIVARRCAIYMAEAAAVHAVTESLLTVACDARDVQHIRVVAAWALSEIGNDDDCKRFKVLLHADNIEDPDGDLRVAAIRALWPRKLMDLEDLLTALDPTTYRKFPSGYDMFLSQELVPTLPYEQLPRILAWLRDHHQKKGTHLTSGQRRLSDSAVLAAWDHIETPVICDALVGYVATQLEHFDSILTDLGTEEEQEKLYQDTERRHTLVTSLVDRIPQFDHHAVFLVRSRFNLLRHDDLGWLLEMAVTTIEKETQAKFAELARWVLDLTKSEDVDQIIVAAKASGAVHSVFQDWLKPVNLESNEAKKMRDNYLKFRDLGLPKNTPKPVDPPMPEQIKNWLDVFESGNVDAWWHLNFDMQFDRSGHATGISESEDDLRELPGWKDADAATRARILTAASVYLDKGDPHTDQWLNTDDIHRPALAGYRALVLLAHEDASALNGLSREIWMKWAPIVLRFPAANIKPDDDLGSRLLTLAYQNAPDEIIRVLNARIDHENKRETEHLFILREVEQCWDRRLCLAMSTRVQESGLKPGCLGELLEQLLDHGCENARSHAGSYISLPLPTDDVGKARAIAATLALLEHSADGGWDIVWPAILNDDEFGRKVMEYVAVRDHHTGQLAGKISESQIAELYLWLESHYPRAEDPRREPAGGFGTREAIADFRDILLRTLEYRGTKAAVSAIQQLLKKLAHLPWLKYTLGAAKKKMLRQTWLPPRPNEIIELCGLPRSRLVRSAPELQDVLIEVLAELNVELQAEIPAAQELWNLPTSLSDPTKIRPKDENRISNWLALRLREKLQHRGIVALREVQIRQGESDIGSRSAGERTDLYVTGTVSGCTDGEFDSVRVIVEVKGCWNDELQSAMRTQLVDRYLKDNTCQEGIYVVGWFPCNQWHSDDSRKRKTPDWPYEQATTFFHNQAEEISSGALRIRAAVLNAALR